jgi:cysteine desulfurase
LYVSRKPRVRLIPIINGGGQERGHRSGTLPTPLIVALGAAARVAGAEMANDEAHAKRLFWRLFNGLKVSVYYCIVLLYFYLFLVLLLVYFCC